VTIGQPTSTPSSAASQDEPWDLLVVGGGTAGIVGAKTAARLGARVLLVERERTGGVTVYGPAASRPRRSWLPRASPPAHARAINSASRSRRSPSTSRR